jgi:peptide-methionine (S)-S-oxide reductase
VGYTGGTKINPSYHNLGDHTETIRIYYDPKKVSYKELLDIFWTDHDPFTRPWSKQYKSVIFYHNEEQKKLAFETKARLEEKLKQKIYTEIVPEDKFYPAEDYHQKYYLRSNKELMLIFKDIYPTDVDFVASTAAARINGYLGGYGKNSELEKDLREAGLYPEAVKKLITALNGRQQRY